MTVTRTSWLALPLLIAAYRPEAATAVAFLPDNFGSPNKLTASSSAHRSLHRVRGGAIVDDDEGDSDGYDEDEEEDDEEIVEKLAASTKTVAQKKKTANIKTKVKVAMMSSSGTAKSSTKSAPRKSLYRRHIPYIIRACLNPFTLIAMTKAYFVSLCDINYLKEVSFFFLSSI
jgi:hypothetical protein